MGIIGTTTLRGVKPAIFRNQPVHQFYGHLQAVLREIEPGGALEHLFARPFSEGGDFGRTGEIRWMTDLTGLPVPFKELPPDQRERHARQLAEALEKIRAYSDQRASAGGKQKDYSDFLRAVAVSPDLDRVVVVDGKVVILHWGFVPEGGVDPNKVVFAGWDEFLLNVKRTAGPATVATMATAAPPPPAPAPAPEPAPEATAEAAPPPPPEPTPEAKPEPKPEPKPEQKPEPKPVLKPEPKPEPKAEPKPEPPPPPEEEKDPNRYWWVKPLAIILAIIILLLLLRRMFAPRPYGMGMPPGLGAPLAGGGGGGALPGGGGGSLPGGGGGLPGGGGGGLPGGGGGSPGGGGLPGGGGGGLPGGGGGSLPGGGGGQPGGGTPEAPGPQTSRPSRPSQSGQPSQPGPSPQTGQPGEPAISLEIKGAQDQHIMSRPPDPRTTWKILDADGKPLTTGEATFLGAPGQTTMTGESATLRFTPGAVAKEVRVIVETPGKAPQTYQFLVQPK
ncbi:MAG: RNA-binding region RNP-1 [Candidatus Ozemobacter sibiricus]|uniref:RNA-binding region RNP-1 n=1 Tax=Candidatus Ozemobacter sibiricus TaxID=2268124 RepID=A0A367ZLH7_9BACT|nr:MAG: RNA-binding region RNP-1 [Candidatus Ozemobacter sibiricus]